MPVSTITPIVVELRNGEHDQSRTIDMDMLLDPAGYDGAQLFYELDLLRSAPNTAAEVRLVEEMMKAAVPNIWKNRASYIAHNNRIESDVNCPDACLSCNEAFYPFPTA